MKNPRLFVLETLVFMLNVLTSESQLCSLDQDFQRSYVGLALSPVYENHNSRHLKIIWGNEKFETGDKIILFTYSEAYGFQTIYEFIPSTPYGIDETGIEAHFRESNIPLFVEQCRRYYVAWIRNGYIRDINCLSNQPTWMFDRYNVLKSRKLGDLFIPGTHHSGTYKTVQGGVRNMRRKSIFNPKVQDLDVMTQLVQGIRYIHVDVGYHPENNETVWWVHKRKLSVVKLDTIIDQVKMFLQYTREIVLFDVQEFSFGFETKEDYMKLLHYTRTRFGTFLPPVEYNWTTPLGYIWNLSTSLPQQWMGKVLLNFKLDNTPFDFPQSDQSFISHKWIKSWDSQDYLEDLSVAEVPPRDLTSKLLLRATVVGPTLLHEDVARELANRINPDITIWYQRFWYHQANIVALDFFEASGIVDVAIKSNEFRYKSRVRVNKTQTGNCISPETESPYPPIHIMNSPFVQALLTPRIVDGAVSKIYDVFPGFLIPPSPTSYIDE